MNNWKETWLELPSNNQNCFFRLINNNYVYKGCFAQQSSAYIYKETSVFMLGAYYEAFTHSIRNSEGAISYQIKPNTSQWVINWVELPADEKGSIYPDILIGDTNCSEKLFDILTLKGIYTIKQLADTESNGLHRKGKFGKLLLYEAYDLLEKYVLK